MHVIVTIPNWLIWGTIVSISLFFSLVFYGIFTGFGKKP